MNFKIDRKLWLRGEGATKSALIREADGKMCCLGFFGIACGLSVNDLMGQKQPSDVKGYPSWLMSTYTNEFDKLNHTGCSMDCHNLMSNNDTDGIDDNERERRIISSFANNDVQVEFVD